MGRPSDPDYWKKWRAAHPEYRARESARKRNRTPEQRKAERDRAKAKSDRAERLREYKRQWAARRRAQGFTPEEREAQLNRQRAWYHRTKTAGDRKHIAAWQQRRRRDMAYMEEADEVVASVGVRRDGRVLYDDGLYDDAVGAAAVALMEAKHLPKRDRRAHAKRAVQNVLKSYKSQQFTTVSLDQPVAGTDGLYFADILEGDWY